MTVRREPIVVPEDARIIAYPEGDYAQSLSRIFGGAMSLDDILLNLGTPWTKIDGAEITTNTDTITFKNLSSDYVQFYIKLYGLLVDSTANASLAIRTSTDNGVTFTSGASTYVYARRIQSTHATTTLSALSAVATEIQLLDGTTTNNTLKTTAANGDHGTLDCYIGHPMDSTRPSTIRWQFARGDTSGNFIWCSGIGSRGATEANNAIAFYTNASRVFTAGYYEMYGLRRAT